MAGYITGAAVLGGELILSLSDGQIIKAGIVAGSRGPKGEPGPMGPTGRDGADGNGMLHGPGFPRPDEGRDNDFFYSTTEVALFGPKTGGSWGSPVYLKPQGDLVRNGQQYDSKQLRGAGRPGRTFAGMGFIGGGPGMTAPTTGGNTAGLEPILIHQQSLKAGAPVIDPVTSTVTTPAVWTEVAIDPQVGGDAFIVDINAEGPAGAMLIEVAVMRDQAKRTGYSQVYEVKTGTPPTLTFDAYNAPNGSLALRMYSSENLVNIRGRILFI